MTQKLLDDSQVGAPVKEMSGKGVAQKVGVNPLVYIG